MASTPIVFPIFDGIFSIKKSKHLHKIPSKCFLEHFLRFGWSTSRHCNQIFYDLGRDFPFIGWVGIIFFLLYSSISLFAYLYQFNVLLVKVLLRGGEV